MDRKIRVWSKKDKRMYYVGEDSVAITIGNAGWPKDNHSPKPQWDLYRCTSDWPQPLAHDKDGDILMWSTGIFDSNNKLIFEHDIIKLALNWDYVGDFLPEHRVFLKETPKRKGFDYKRIDWEGGEFAHFVTNPQRCNFSSHWLMEVVGNIYENTDIILT